MDRRSFLSATAVAASSLVFRSSVHGEAAPVASPAEQAAAIRSAAAQFLQTLGPERQAKMTFPYPGRATPAMAKFTRTPGPGGPPPGAGPARSGEQAAERGQDRRGGPGGPGGGPANFAFVGEKYGQSMWTNFPVSDVPRPGLRMGDLSAAERTAAFNVLRTVLSPMGYQKVQNIMAADQRLHDEGTNYASGNDVYTMALFGQPAATSPWMLQFGGHHLGLNVIFVGDRAVCAPLHTGILPSKFTDGGKSVRALGRENDLAFDLVAMLTPAQLKAATIEHDVSDLVFGPGHPDATLALQGLAGSAMSARQRDILFHLAAEWAGLLNQAHAAPRLHAIRQQLPELRFAWSGPTTHEPNMNGESYFRLHGPSLLIEHAPQGNQGGYKLHVHTVMRDLGNDYAKQWI